MGAEERRREKLDSRLVSVEEHKTIPLGVGRAGHDEPLAGQAFRRMGIPDAAPERGAPRPARDQGRRAAGRDHENRLAPVDRLAVVGRRKPGSDRLRQTRGLVRAPAPDLADGIVERDREDLAVATENQRVVNLH